MLEVEIVVPAGDVLPRFPVVISPDRSPPVVEPKERHVGAMVQRKAHAEEARRGEIATLKHREHAVGFARLRVDRRKP